jgi:4-diphosphocytidyl-2-C-methyl-D-erythritol kinase
MMTALRSGDARALGAALTNDLQAAAISLMPALGDVLDAGLEFGALGGIVSGSGPTVAFLAEDNEAAIDLAVSLTASGAVQDVRRATGPAHGAHLISNSRAG